MVDKDSTKLARAEVGALIKRAAIILENAATTDEICQAISVISIANIAAKHLNKMLRPEYQKKESTELIKLADRLRVQSNNRLEEELRVEQLHNGELQ